MTYSDSPLGRYALPIAIACTGPVLAWVVKEPSGLLVTVVGVSVLGGRRVSLLSAAICALALAAFLLVVGWDSLIARQANLRLAVFLAVGLGISVLIYFCRAAGFSGRDGSEARLIVESMPGYGWSADPSGKFTYVSPKALSYVGQSTEKLSRIEGTDDFGWQRVVHPDDYDRVAAQWLHCLKTGEPYENEHRIRSRDGTYRWFRNCGVPSRDPDGRIAGWYGTTIDIDDQKNAEFTLRTSERQLQQLIDAVPALIWSTTSEGRPTYLNKRYTEVTGATLEDLVASDGSSAPLAVVYPDDKDASAKVRAHAFETGDTYVVRYRQIRRDGSYRWTETRAEPLRDDAGAILQWYGVSVDIHDLVTAQEALRDREQELSQLVDMVPSHVWRLSPDGEPAFFNKRMVDFLGRDVTEIDRPGMSRLAALAEAFVHPDDSTEFLDSLRGCLVLGESFAMRYRLRRIDGVYRWMSSRAEPMRDHAGRIVHWYGLCHDIDDQMHAEEALRRSERELQQLVDALPAYIWSWTPDGKLAYVNKRYLDHLGLSDKKFEDLARVVQELVHPDDAPEVQRTAANCLETGEAFVMRYRRRGKDGDYRWMEGRCDPLRDQDGTIVHWYHVSIDVDDEMRVQEALRERERQLQLLVDTIPAFIWCLTPEGTPSYFNKRVLDQIGVTVADLTAPDGSLRLESIHPDDRPAVERALAHSLKSGEPFGLKYRQRRGRASYRWTEGHAEALRDENGKIVQWYGVYLDIEDEVVAQQALRSAQDKLARATQAASLSELAASIAHEVNQPLAAIVATSHACRRWLSADPPNLERATITLERIIRDANSASDVVSRIRALFNQMGKARSPADITEVIAEVFRLMADELAMKNIQVETEFDGSLPVALIDRVQMQQVLINLIRNAIDALDAVTEGARLIQLRAVLDGESAIRVEVRDLGAGMKEPDRVFEPFFTTKQNGMGMGLAICRSIIESHDGRLWAANNAPRGTTLAFTLPIRAKDTA